MTTAFIFVLSVVALLQFFISYCRSVIAATVTQPVSDQVREVTGIRDPEIDGAEFARLLQLARLCPETGKDRARIAAVRAYYRLLSVFRTISGRYVPGVVSWTERELSRCAHFAAIALDRRINYSRGLMAQQLSS
ncbi:MAG TPA: hypothetical protein VKR82_14160 [Candidatus Acidoferrales bacterium]|nr:hypothetical protein [Candidatus Acidoferrales bacterium]